MIFQISGYTIANCGGVLVMKKRKTITTVLIVLLILILCSVGVILFLHRKSPSPNLEPDTDAQSWQGEQELDKPKTEIKQIAIPGIESLVFIEGQTKQAVNFYNPKENDCLIVFSLHVDNHELWRSGYCEPDKGYYSIELNEPLEKGEYSATLLHECYRRDGTRLNSANVQFTLYVQEE